MRFKKLITGISIVGLMALGGCSSKKAGKAPEVKHVGVLQVVQHPSLDKAYKGFKKGLKESGFVEGKNLKIDYQNAQNNQDNLKSMSEKLVNEKSDLILGIATPAAQSVANATQKIPTVVTAVTDLKAAKLVDSETLQEQQTWFLLKGKLSCCYQLFLKQKRLVLCTMPVNQTRKYRPI